MEKLTKEQIQFIENYLEHSDVYYADIRMEMTDHVASAIEAKMKHENTNDFYTIFKNYMVKNKANLLENNKKFIRDVDKSIFKRLVKLLLKPQNIMLFIVLLVLGYQFFPSIDRQQLLAIGSWFPLFSIVPFLIVYFGSLRAFKISRFSGIERIGFVYMIVFQMLNLTRTIFKSQLESDHTNYWVIIVLVATIITVSVVLLQLTFHIINDYRKQYKRLA